MSRALLIVAALGGVAAADPDAPYEQSIGASLGVSSGSHVTPGGVRLAGHYGYQLSDQDFFDGAANFTYGGGGAQCFYDRTNQTICNHGLVGGAGVELAATVRRYFDAQGSFRPFAMGGFGAGVAQFSEDGVTGLTLMLHVGGGVRAVVGNGVAIVGQADLQLGLGLFDAGLGAEGVAGLAVTAGVEFKL